MKAQITGKGMQMIRIPIFISVFFGFLFFLLALPGCQSFRSEGPPRDPTITTNINRAVVIGFLPALQPGDKPRVIRGSFSGSVFKAEPVPREKADLLTNRLMNELIEAKTYQLISPGQAKGMFASLLSENMSAQDIEIYTKIGRAFSADAILIGHLYRWREREGTDYATDSPASVAFDLYLIRSENGGIIWRDRFDKAQRSLTENLFDMRTFFRGGGKWLTADDLAGFGLQDMLIKMPENVKKSED